MPLLVYAWRVPDADVRDLRIVSIHRLRGRRQQFRRTQSAPHRHKVEEL